MRISDWSSYVGSSDLIDDLEVQRHAADAAGELDHLAGLALVEPVDAGDAVADAEDPPDLGDLGLLAEIADLLLEDRGDFRRLDFHLSDLFQIGRASFQDIVCQ